VVTYRELRLLDLEVVRAIRLRTGQLVTNTDMLKNVWLTQFHGLEIKPVSWLLRTSSLTDLKGAPAWRNGWFE
jgi:hypothetical protein